MDRPTDQRSAVVHLSSLSLMLLLLQTLFRICDAVDLCKYYTHVYIIYLLYLCKWFEL